MKIRNITSLNSGRKFFMLSSFSKWWSLVIVLSLAFNLPYVSSDDPSLLSKDTLGKRYRIADITYLNPLTQKTESISGKFGINSIEKPVAGIVISPKSKSDSGKEINNLGCSRYQDTTIPNDSWIALVERGLCYFSDKVKIAIKESNASAIIIYNNVTTTGDSHSDLYNSHVIDMDGQDKKASAVSVFISKEDGLKIVDLLNKNHVFTLKITPGVEGTVQKNNSNNNSISKTSVLFVSISFIVLMIISLAWLGFYYIQRFRYSHAKERLARRLACAAKKAIAKIPQKTIKSGDKELENDFDQCAVCIEPYKAHDVIRILPCRHVFHKSCVDPWLLDQRSCPMCKLDILRAYGMQVGGSQESVRPDPEVGHAPARLVPQHTEPEPGSSHGEPNPEDMKVLLVAHSCLHFHVPRDKEQKDEASTSLLGAVGGVELVSLPHSSSSSSLNSKASGNTRVRRCDAEAGGSPEKEALLSGSSEEGIRRWKSEEEEEEDFDDARATKSDNSGQISLIESTELKDKGKKHKRKNRERSGETSHDSSSLASDAWEADVTNNVSEETDQDKDSCSCVTAGSDDESCNSSMKVEFRGVLEDELESTA